jgi:hypothetical protein
VNTSGASDGGTIRIGGIPVGSGPSLPSNVTISGSSLVADPPGLGGTISVDGALITISGSSFNVFGLSGGTISLGSASTASLSLDALSSLIGGGGASFGLVAGSISNSASVSGGVLSLNGQLPAVLTPTITVPPLVTFQQSVDSLQPLQTATTIDYTAPLSPLTTQWEVVGLDLLALNLSESSFLYSDNYDAYKTQQDALQLDQIQQTGSSEQKTEKAVQQRIRQPNQQDDQQKKLLEDSLVRTGGNPTLRSPVDNQAEQKEAETTAANSALPSVNGSSRLGQIQQTGSSEQKTEKAAQQRIRQPNQQDDQQKKLLEDSLVRTGGNPTLRSPADNQAQQRMSGSSAASAGQQQTGGLVNQPVQQLSEQQVSAQFTVAEQKAAETTAEKLGLPPVNPSSVLSPPEIQTLLRQAIEAQQRRSGQ